MPAINKKFQMFQVQIGTRAGSEITSFQDILDNAPTDWASLFKNEEEFNITEKIQQTRQIYSGTFCLVQTSDLPQRYKFGGVAKDLDLDEDEGLSHYTSFIFDPDNDIMLIEINKNGISPSDIARFFKSNFRDDLRRIAFHVVIQPSDISRLLNMSEIRNVDLSIANVTGGGILGGDGTQRGINELKSIADKSNADSISVKITMGYKQGSLRKNWIVALLRRLARVDNDGDIKRMTISGTEKDSDAQRVIDFINNKVVIEASATKSRHSDFATVKRIIAAAIKEYRELKPHIDSSYKAKRNSDHDG